MLFQEQGGSYEPCASSFLQSALQNADSLERRSQKPFSAVTKRYRDFEVFPERV